VLDWSWGKIYAVHLAPSGSTYTATKEEFVTGGPLPVSDAIIGKDGAMYFTIGGRRVQSGLYRVTYTGKEDTSPIAYKTVSGENPDMRKERNLRHSLEAYHGKQDPKAVSNAWPHLSSNDRYIRAAARTALEHQPVTEWEAKALSETNATAQLEALLALTRVTGVCPTHRTADHVVNTDKRQQILAALLQRDFAKLNNEQRMAYVRLIQIVLHRFGNPDETNVAAIIAMIDHVYPADNFELNWLLTETLAYLQAPNTAAKGMALIAAAESQEPQVEYARSLRFLKAGWTPELRKQQLEFFLKAANYKGGASFDKFIEFIRNDSLSTFTDAEKTQFAELIAKKPERKTAIENVGAMFVGRTPTMWTLDELSAATKTGMKGRSYDNGRKMFSRRRLLHLPPLWQRRRHDRPRFDRRWRTLQPARPARSNHQPQQRDQRAVRPHRRHQKRRQHHERRRRESQRRRRHPQHRPHRPQPARERRSKGSEEHRTQQSLPHAPDAPRHAQERRNPRPPRLRPQRRKQGACNVWEVASIGNRGEPFLTSMNRWIKNVRDTLTATAALGILALVWLFITQVIAITLAVVVGVIVSIAYEWQSGLLAGILAYAIVMKLAWYLEIFDMIRLSSKRRGKPASQKNRPSS
jgi:hypothetical protein